MTKSSQTNMRRRGASRNGTAMRPKASVAGGYSYGQLNARAKGTVQGDELVFEYTELAMTCTVPASTAPPQTVNFYPGASGMSRLDAFALLYSQYRVEMCELEFRPAVGTNTSGIQVTGFSYDFADVPQNLSTCLSVEPRFSDVPWIGGKVSLPVDRMMKSRWHFTANGSNPSGFNAAGAIFWHASGANGAILGNIWCRYRIRFSGPYQTGSSILLTSNTFPGTGSATFGLAQQVATDFIAGSIPASGTTNMLPSLTNTLFQTTGTGAWKSTNSSGAVQVFGSFANALQQYLPTVSPSQLVELILGITLSGFTQTGTPTYAYTPTGNLPQTGKPAIMDSNQEGVPLGGSNNIQHAFIRLVDYISNLSNGQFSLTYPGTVTSGFTPAIVSLLLRPYTLINQGNAPLPTYYSIESRSGRPTFVMRGRELQPEKVDVPDDESEDSVMVVPSTPSQPGKRK